MDHWLSIEIFDGEFPASSWRRAHGDNLTETAITNGALRVEEIFRFASPIERSRAARRGGLTRYASVDVKADGVTIHAGDTVMFAVQEANEDESVFPNPKRFDITRERIPHLSLSHGAHFCLGAHLARVELQYLFVRLLERFPTLRLAVPLEEIPPIREAVAGAVSQLPVTW